MVKLQPENIMQSNLIKTKYIKIFSKLLVFNSFKKSIFFIFSQSLSFSHQFPFHSLPYVSNKPRYCKIFKYQQNSAH